MEDHVKECLLSLSRQDISDSERYEASQELVSLSSDYSFLQLLLQILITSTSMNLSITAALNLRRSLSAQWESISGSHQHCREIKDQIISALKAQSITLVAKNLAAALEPIFIAEQSKWPELISFISELDANKTAFSVEFAQTILSYFFPTIPSDHIPEFYSLFNSLATYSFSSGSDDLITSACEMVSAYSCNIPEDSLSSIQREAEAIIMLFQESIKSSKQQSFALARTISSLFSLPAPPFDPASVFESLISLSIDPSIPSDFYSPLFTSMESILTYHPSSVRHLLPQFIAASIFCASSVFNSQFFDDSPEIREIAAVVSTSAKAFPDASFFSLLQSSMKMTSEAEAVSSCIIFYYCTSYLGTFVTQHLSEVTDLILRTMHSESLYLKEASILMASETGHILSSSESATSIIEGILPFTQSGSELFVKTSIQALNSIFSHTKIDAPTLASVLSNLRPILEFTSPRHVLEEAISCIGSLIASAEALISEFASEIFRILVTFASLPEEEDSTLKGLAFTSLSYLIKFNPTAQMTESFVTELMKSSVSEDDDLRSSVVISVGTLVQANVAGVDAFKNEIGNMIDFCFQIDATNPDAVNDSEESISRPGAVTCLGYSLDLIAEIFRGYKQLIPDDYSKWYMASIVLIDMPIEDVASSAINAATSITIFNKAENKEFFEALSAVALDPCPDMVGAVFRSLKHLVRAGVVLDDDATEMIVGMTNSVLSGEIKLESGDQSGMLKPFFHFFPLFAKQYPNEVREDLLFGFADNIIGSEECAQDMKQECLKCLTNAQGFLSKQARDKVASYAQ